MLEQLSLVSRLDDQLLHSVLALRDIGSAYSDEHRRLLHEHNEHIEQCRASQKTRNEARAHVLWTVCHVHSVSLCAKIL